MTSLIVLGWKSLMETEKTKLFLGKSKYSYGVGINTCFHKACGGKKFAGKDGIL